MTTQVRAGTLLIDDWPVLAPELGLESEPYSGSWSIVRATDSCALDRKIHAAGWNFFFMATEAKVTFFGAIGAKSVRKALKRHLGTVTLQNFNCLEVTGIVSKSFLGVRYASISAHSRHIQKGCLLDSAQERRTAQQNAEWARE